MPGLSDILEVARRALMSQRIGMDTTSHNISNVNTIGYSRQRVDFAASRPIGYSFGLLGTGVTVDHIGRLRDAFTDAQIRTANQGYGESSVEHGILSQIESAFNEPSSTGISHALTAFFNAFQDLSVHPEDTGIRNVVLQRTQELTGSFHTVNSALSQMRTNLVDEITGRIDEINRLTHDISELDIQVTSAMAAGLDPNDAKDQRDLKIEQLSKLVDISVSFDNRGSVMVSAGGTAIASRAGSVVLKANITGSGAAIVEAASGNPVAVRSGELGGVLTMYNTTLPDYLAKLDQVAGALIARVNTLHAAGFGLGPTPPTGNALFTGTDAATINVDPAIAGNVNLLAASGDGSVGNNATALAIANVGAELLLNGNSVSISSFFNGIVSTIGSAVNAAKSSISSTDVLLQTLEQQRSSVAGVSLDEEMTNMIKFQHAYDAAAKLVTTTDELFKTILNMV